MAYDGLDFLGMTPVSERTGVGFVAEHGALKLIPIPFRCATRIIGIRIRNCSTKAYRCLGFLGMDPVSEMIME